MDRDIAERLVNETSLIKSVLLEVLKAISALAAKDKKEDGKK